jgi:hypothetical protein
MSKVKYFPRTVAEYQRSPTPSSMQEIPTMKTDGRFHDMAAWGRNKESAKSIAIPVHQRTTMRFREP